jgi:hypothetical protein
MVLPGTLGTGLTCSPPSRRHFRLTCEVRKADRSKTRSSMPCSWDGCRTRLAPAKGSAIRGCFPIPVVPRPVRWLVFGSDGALVATVRTLERFQPHAVRDEQAWGVMMDELDAESIRAYEMVEP